MDTQAQIEREAEMYARGAELDLDLAQHFHALAKGAEDREDAVGFARAYNHCMRSMRQSLGYRARLRKQEREHEREQERLEAARPQPAPPPRPPADPALVAERQDQVRTALQRVIWHAVALEQEPLDDEQFEDGAEPGDPAGYLFDVLEQRLAAGARDPAFADEALDDHVMRLGTDFRLPAAALLDWRSLPDPPSDDGDDTEDDGGPDSS